MLHVFCPPGSRTPSIQLMPMASREVTLHSYFILISYFVYLPLSPPHPLRAAGSRPATLPTFKPCPAIRPPPLPALPIRSTTRGPLLPASSTPATHSDHIVANLQASFFLHGSSRLRSRSRSGNLLCRQRSRNFYLLSFFASFSNVRRLAAVQGLQSNGVAHRFQNPTKPRSSFRFLFSGTVHPAVPCITSNGVTHQFFTTLHIFSSVFGPYFYALSI